MADVNFSASPETSAAAVISVMGGGVSSLGATAITGAAAVILSIGGGVTGLSGATVTTCDANISSMFGRTASLQGTSITSALAQIPTMSGGVVSLSGSATTEAFAVIPSITGGTVFIQGNASTSADAVLTITGGNDSRGVSLCGVVHEVLMLWGIACIKNAPKFAIERAINDVNAALQMIWNHAADRTYWTGSTLTLNFADGAMKIDLPNSIQNVIGPCRRADNKRPLVPVGTMGELDTFSDLYLDSQTAEEPLAYHVERLAQTGTDPARCILHVTPEVQGDAMDLELDVVMEAPRFIISDLDTCPLIPIPHQYVETLLLPIARYRAAGFTMLFNRPERQEVIDREYEESRLALGLADPLPGNSGDNRPQPTPAK